jgi:hypothetical protein
VRLVALVALLLLAGCAVLRDAEWHFGISNTWEFDVADSPRRR